MSKQANAAIVPASEFAADPQRLEDLLARVMRAGATDAAVEGAIRQTVQVEVRDGRFVDLVQEETASINVTAFIGQKRSTISTNRLDRETLDTLVERVIAMSRLAQEDPWCGLADPAQIIGEGNDDALELADPRMPSPADLEDWACQVEDAARSVEMVRLTEAASASSHRVAGAVVASNGLMRTTRGTHFGAGVVVIAADAEDRQIGHAGRAARWIRDLPDLSLIGLESGKRAAGKLGARKIPGCRAPVIIDRLAAMSLVQPLLGALSGHRIARKNSFLHERLGQKILPEAIDIIEDPHVRRGHASRPCDGEGLPTTHRALVDKGVITTWTLDLASARELGLTSTAHAGGLSNVHLSPGMLSREGLMADAGRGLLVTDIMGESINPHSGDCSFGVAGFWFENGQIVHAVNEMTIAGNLLEIYDTLVAGSDLEFQGSMNAPSLLVSHMAISGA